MELLLPLVTGAFTDLYFHRRCGLRWPLGLCTATLSYFALQRVSPYSPAYIIKGLLLSQLLLVAAYNDARTHEISDWIDVLLLLVGIIYFQPQSAILGFFIVSVPFLLIAKFTHGGIGGGDVKLVAACGFVLGAFGVVFGCILAMVCLICVHLIHLLFNRRVDRQKAYAMAPYLAIGCFFAYLMT